MEHKRDYYEVLGLDKNATAEDIKKSFRKLSIKFHPDKQVGKSDNERKEAEDKFKEIAEAYEVLSNPDKKKKYDMYGFGGQGGFDFDGGVDLNDIFSKYSDFFSGSDPFGFGGGKHGKRARVGGDLKISIKLSINEMINGATKKIRLKRFVKCSHCGGAGSEDGVVETCLNCGGTGQQIKTTRTPFGIQQTITTCTECGGTGKKIKHKCHKCGGAGICKEDEIIEIKIPSGAIPGYILRMDGYGNFPENPNDGDMSGTLFIAIDEVKDDKFIRDDYNITCNVFIDVPTAIIGGVIKVPTVDGKTKEINIKPGTQSGTPVVFRGEGIPIDGNMRGNFIVNINVYIPEKLNEEEKAIFEKLRNSNNFKKKCL